MPVPKAFGTGIFSFAAISVTSSKPRQFMLITKKTFLQKTSHGVAWDLVRFDRDGKKDTISTVRQQYSHREITMTTKALFVRLEAKPGKENEVAKFLRDGQGLV